MKILFIAPLPPPVNGHSLVSKVLLDGLNNHHDVCVVNCSKDSFKEGVDGPKRIVEVLEILGGVWKGRAQADAVYLTISESLAGNVKDLFTYLICYKSLHQMHIQLHGGTIKKELWEKHSFLYRLNRFFIKRMAGVVISGESHREIFDGLIDDPRIHIVPNFAQPYLFSDIADVPVNFEDATPLRILYMSGLKEKKGYNDLLEGYFLLDDASRRRVTLDFAGRFGSQVEENTFLDKIAGVPQIRYHGMVDDDEKRRLFSEAHVFCLPTSYREGQPISILEAYASGCVVLTTGQSGIRDIFEDRVNGFEIAERSPEAVRDALEKTIESADSLLNIALENRRTAGESYRMESFQDALRTILESPSSRAN